MVVADCCIENRRCETLGLLIFTITETLQRSGNPAEHNDTIVRLVDGVWNGLDRLYDLDLRNFLLLPPPPLDLTPRAILPSLGFVADTPAHRDLGLHFIDLLAKGIEPFEEKHPGVNLFYFDQDSFVRIVTDFPELFGITDTKRYMFHVNDGKGLDKYLDRGQVGFM